MQARVGDKLVVRGHKVGDVERVAEIVDVRGSNGTPPFVVRWESDGHEAVVFPGPDAVVERGEGTGRAG